MASVDRMMEATKRSSLLWPQCLAGSRSIFCDFVIYNWIPLACHNILLQIRLWLTPQGGRFEHIDSYAYATAPWLAGAETECGCRVLLQGPLMEKDMQRALLFNSDSLEKTSSIPFRDNACISVLTGRLAHTQTQEVQQCSGDGFSCFPKKNALYT